jgi:hypothetical protein
MPNAIKYNVSAETLALKKGNFYIGTGDVGKGPTSSTGYYNGITPPSGGYTIYLNKETGGPSIYTVTTEAQMVSLTNTIGAQSFTTSGQCLNWFATQTDKMIFNIDYPAIVTNGLVLNLDAGFTPSYSQSGTTWYDVSGTNNGTLTNGPTFNTDNGGSIVLDGVNDYVNCGNNSVITSITNQLTIGGFVRFTNLGDYRRFIFKDNGNEGVMELFYNVNVSKLDFEIVTSTTGRTSLRSTTTPVVNQIYNLVGTYDGSNMKIYVNGILESTTSKTGNINQGTPSGALFLGNTNGFSNPYSFYLAGNIYNVQIYNRVLNATEVLQNYNAQKGRFGL